MGRPSLIITDAQRGQVAQWIRERVPLERMAQRLGMAPKTFRKHFGHQLGTAPVPDAAPLLPDEFLPARQALFDAYRPTAEMREIVMVLAGAAISKEEIARKLGQPVDVIEYHFAEELASGSVAKANVIMAMYRAAIGGNVSAQKSYTVIGALLGGPEDPAGDRDRDRQPAPPAETFAGKKIQAAIESQNADRGTPWERVIN
jgi:AraC-like DNA-binding protein